MKKIRKNPTFEPFEQWLIFDDMELVSVRSRYVNVTSIRLAIACTGTGMHTGLHGAAQLIII